MDVEADLSPRPVAAAPARRKRKLGPSLLLAGVLLGGGFVVFQFLNNSTTYFCNADELGVKAECTGSRHIRLQGTVTPQSVQKGAPLKFSVTYGAATIPVTYEGDPGGVFCEGIPVVVEGIYKGSMFQGDRILIKHTEQYRAANPERTAGDRDCGL